MAGAGAMRSWKPTQFGAPVAEVIESMCSGAGKLLSAWGS